MDSEEQLELSEKALKHLVEEDNLRSSLKVDDHHHQHLLPNLLSQDDIVEQPNESDNIGMQHRHEVVSSDDEITIDDSKEILRELREIKKQNKRTHWLLSTMIVLTLTWQLSEVSILLKFKEGITNPFKAIGNLFTEIISKRRKASNGYAEKDDAAEENQDSSSMLPQWHQGS